MAVGLDGRIDARPVPGVRVGAAALGGRREPRDDLVVFELAPGTAAAAVFTRNAFCAAPVTVARWHLGAGRSPRYLLVNSGNANAGTGERGIADALACCDVVAAAGGCERGEVLPFSTGVIGEFLEVERFRAAVPAALAALEPAGWDRAARAIMTTDTVPKALTRTFAAGDVRCTVTGTAKGAGMIRPDMATMLAFIATDAPVEPEPLQECLQGAVARTFNRITVDGDTSTNDACVLVATGAAPAERIVEPGTADFAALAGAVESVCTALAQAIVRDAEGATKFVTVEVRGGRSEDECLQVAYAVAQSPLVKTALFASDPNWGRILAAVGRAGLRDLDIEAVRIEVGDVCIVAGGGRAPGYAEADGQRVFAEPEIPIRIALGRGRATATVWTSDLSLDYVRINAEYRT